MSCVQRALVMVDCVCLASLLVVRLRGTARQADLLIDRNGPQHTLLGDTHAPRRIQLRIDWRRRWNAFLTGSVVVFSRSEADSITETAHYDLTSLSKNSVMNDAPDPALCNRELTRALHGNPAANLHRWTGNVLLAAPASDCVQLCRRRITSVSSARPRTRHERSARPAPGSRQRSDKRR